MKLQILSIYSLHYSNLHIYRQTNLKYATQLPAVNEWAAQVVTLPFIDEVIAAIPSDWLLEETDRQVYADPGARVSASGLELDAL